jgi:putative tryptophan/tyrosine transport system substrate-binding protein
MIKRREFITLIGGAAAWPLAARAQQGDRGWRVGVLMSTDPGNQEQQGNLAAFEQVLRTLGWTNGQNLKIDYRYTAGNLERLHSSAVELLALKPDLIVVTSTAVLNAMQPASQTIPMIFLGVSDPVAQGFVSNLAHPGGNLTGFAAYEFSMGAKWLDLLKQVSPGLTRATLLYNPDTSPQFKFNLASIEAAAPQFGVEVIAAPVRSSLDLERAIEEISMGQQGGLIVGNDQFLQSRHLQELVDLAARLRVPSIYAQRPFVQAGGLMYYGFVTIAQWRALASYVDRILKGTKVGDLPVQQPTKFELVINLKTAKALGLTIPPGVLAIADEVIE